MGGRGTQSAPNSTREGGHPCFALSPRVCGAGRRLLKTLSCTGGKLQREPALTERSLRVWRCCSQHFPGTSPLHPQLCLQDR